MSLLLAAALVAGLPTLPSFEGAWTHDPGGTQIYVFSKTGFHLIVRHVNGRKPQDAGYRAIFEERGTLNTGRRSFPIGGGKWQDFDFLRLQRTRVDPPGVEKAFARDEPNRVMRIEMPTINSLKINGMPWIRIDPKSVPKTPEEIKTKMVVQIR